MGKAEEEEDGESTWIAPSEDSPLPISPSSFRFAPSPLVELDDARDDDEKEPTGAVVDAEAVDKETTKGEVTIDLEDIVSFTDRWMRPSTPPPPILSAEDDESRSFLGEDEDGLLRRRSCWGCDEGASSRSLSPPLETVASESASESSTSSY